MKEQATRKIPAKTETYTVYRCDTCDQRRQSLTNCHLCDAEICQQCIVLDEDVARTCRICYELRHTKYAQAFRDIEEEYSTKNTALWEKLYAERETLKPFNKL